MCLDIVSDKALANVFCIKAILRLATKNCFCESSQRLIQPRLVRWFRRKKIGRHLHEHRIVVCGNFSCRCLQAQICAPRPSKFVIFAPPNSDPCAKHKVQLTLTHRTCASRTTRPDSTTDSTGAATKSGEEESGCTCCIRFFVSRHARRRLARRIELANTLRKRWCGRGEHGR